MRDEHIIRWTVERERMARQGYKLLNQTPDEAIDTRNGTIVIPVMVHLLQGKAYRTPKLKGASSATLPAPVKEDRAVATRLQNYRLSYLGTGCAYE